MITKAAKYGLLSILFIIIYLAVYGSGSDEQPLIIYNHPSPDEISHDLNICKTRSLSLNVRSALIVDNNIGAWIYAKRAQTVRPIASLTKLLTAMVYLDDNPNLDTTVYISGRDCYESAKSHIYKGEAYRARDLLYAALMSSDNRAARAIATASGLARDIFIERMNKKARSLGMMNTELLEVTGLDERNVSTAADVAILINAAAEYSEIRECSSKYIYNCQLQNKKRKKRFINTNRLVRSKWNVQVGKTGFIMESDYCLATILKNKAGQELTIVTLGSPTNNVRFSVARKLAQYGFKRAGRYNDGKQIAGR